MPRSHPAANAVSVDDPGLVPVSSLAGVGPVLEASLHRLGLRKIQDLWFHLPLRYEDRTRLTPIRDLNIGESAQVEGTIEAVERGFRFRPQLRVVISDDSRSMLSLRFFSFRRAQIDQLTPGTRLRCFGQVRHGAHGPEIVHPQYQRLSSANVSVEDCLTPIYPTTEGLGQRRMATLISLALEKLPGEAELELVPEALRKPLDMLSLRDALLTVHRPPADADVSALTLGTHEAQRRLAFEELLTHHLSLKQMRAQVREHGAPPLNGDGALRKALLTALPFALTGAQERVSAEIAVDLARPEPMLRLVQGDVGSGKTIVAAWAALAAIESGYQVALMA
ncbi:MAG: ATP-dependent DNA helicase RecG, partial [Dokdonella sp.]